MKKLLVVLFSLFGLFVGGTFIVGVYAYTTNGYIDISFNYSYTATQLNTTQELYLRTDIGDISINYNDTKMEETI